MWNAMGKAMEFGICFYLYSPSTIWIRLCHRWHIAFLFFVGFVFNSVRWSFWAIYALYTDIHILPLQSTYVDLCCRCQVNRVVDICLSVSNPAICYHIAIAIILPLILNQCFLSLTLNKKVYFSLCATPFFSFLLHMCTHTHTCWGLQKHPHLNKCVNRVHAHL